MSAAAAAEACSCRQDGERVAAHRQRAKAGGGRRAVDLARASAVPPVRLEQVAAAKSEACRGPGWAGKRDEGDAGVHVYPSVVPADVAPRTRVKCARAVLLAVVARSDVGRSKE